MEMLRIPCEKSIDCPAWPVCHQIVVDGVIVCAAIYTAMRESVDVPTTDFDIDNM